MDQLIFFYIYNLNNLDIHQYYNIYHIQTHKYLDSKHILYHIHLYQLILCIHIYIHLHFNHFHLQIILSNLHMHLQVSCHFICLISLVYDIRLNTLTFKYLTVSGTQIFAYELLMLLLLPLHLFILILKG